MNEKIKDHEPGGPTMTEAEFAVFGGSQIAYIKAMKSEQAKILYPQLKGVPEGIDIYAVHAADGTPLALADSRMTAIANAREHDLEPVSVH